MRHRSRGRPVLPGLPGLAALTAAALLLGAATTPLQAQEETDPLVRVPTGEQGWNTPEVRRLVERARARRQQPVADSALVSYRAEVSGFVYFFIDREGEPEPVLLRADQVALDLYWAQPNRVKQVVKGLRSEEQFPIRDFQYYLDRYTVIQNGFDDVIRVGEGRDVRNVIHPLASVGDGSYDFRLADSVAIRLPGEPDPLLVYEIQVRPKNFDLPAIVGSLFVERARGDLVRLAFTFTPSSYLDPRNERVEVMLENALWEGKYWLPREQRLLVRREIPELDLDVGTVIRGGLRVDDYELNVDLPDSFFSGREVVRAAGPEALARYEFDRGLYEGFADVGMLGAEPGTLDAVDVDAIAGEILRERFFRGIPRVRFFAPAASDVIRYDRAEGLVIGVGASVGVRASQLYGYGGWAFGARHPVAVAGWKAAGPATDRQWSAQGYLNRPVEVGLRPAAAGVLSSLSAAILGQDLRDIYLASGARAGWSSAVSDGRRWRAGLAVEHHSRGRRAVSTAPFDDQRAFRPATPAIEDTRLVLDLGLDRWTSVGRASVRVQPSAALVARTGLHDTMCLEPLNGTLVEVDCPSELFGRVGLDADLTWRAPDLRSRVTARLSAAALTGTPPAQDYLYIGGHNTLPGHPLHAYVGTRAAVVDVTAARAITPRLLQLRLLASAGWAGPADLSPPVPSATPGSPVDPWTPAPADGVATSVGAGVGLVDGILRLDYVIRTDTGRGVFLLSTDPRLWSFL